MDVDKEKIAIAVMGPDDTTVVKESIIANTEEGVSKFIAKLKKTDSQIHACYEAGFCGFQLARQLSGMGIGCAVAAPGMLPRMPSHRVKTDRRDARLLARALRNGDVHEVYIPTVQDEAVRDYLRMYQSVKNDLKRAKQRLLHFLLRRRLRYASGTNWTLAHHRWLKALSFEQPCEQRTFDEYYARIAELEEHCERMAAHVEQIACEERYAEPVRELKAFKGIETLIALSLVVEVGDFRRFATAAQFMAFLGLVPSERSSGGKRRQGGITKAGNSHLRKLLVEAAWQYRSYHAGSRRLAKRREGLPLELVTYANKAGRRLNKKCLRLIFSGKKKQVATTAVARELSGFIWGAMTGRTA
jgi:transposase